MSKSSDTKISKTLSYRLRHKPEAGGLTLNQSGWASVDLVLMALGSSRLNCDWDGLLQVVDRNDKQRFELSADGSQIRARQGHSVTVDLELLPVAPPEKLYHGTVERFWVSIADQGLLPMQRHHVHLSADIETARKVGARRGKPMILVVDAKGLAATGQKFFLTKNGVWLTQKVPPGHIKQLS
jgi:putative RNA 2'-phosphotransferase